VDARDKPGHDGGETLAFRRMGEPTGRANARPMTGSAIPIFFRDNLDGFRKPARFIAGHFLRSDGLVNQQAGHA
jgi:hypothetical protein